MTAVFSLQPTVPSENWDDDFEFHQNHSAAAAASNGKGVSTSHDHSVAASFPSDNPMRMSTASSHLTEDWDRDQSPIHDTFQSKTTNNAILEDKKNHYNPQWADTEPPSPSPKRHTNNLMPMPHSTTTENWDDDFEDKTDSPTRKTPRKTNNNAKTHHARTASGSRLGPSRSRGLDAPESWDDEFDIPATPSKPPRDPETEYMALNDAHQMHGDDAEFNSLEEDDDDDMELGFADKEEDRTVTARSRRAALSHLGPSNATPPPPVPPIPLSILTATNPNNLPPEKPFPRSPTASVFSVPTLNSGSGRDSVAYSYYHNNSTTHLRPTMSRTSFGGLHNLPPSPPIHKERERRRLRKKSRPPEAGVYELTAMRNPPSYPHPNNASSDILESGSGEGSSLDHAPSPHASPQASTSRRLASPDPFSSPSGSKRNSTSASIGLPSPSGKVPLLSRIGSVKKWGVRKKRASSTPSEVMIQESERYAGGTELADMNEHEHTPRPPGSATSNAGMSSSPPSSSKSNWFFRASSSGAYGSSPPNRVRDHPSGSSSRSSTRNSHENGSFTDLHTRDREREREREHERSMMYAPFPAGSSSDMQVDTPSKLVKRKSLGFVQIRKSKGPINDGLPSDLPPDLQMEIQHALDAGADPKRKRPASEQQMKPSASSAQARNTSYAALGLGRVRERTPERDRKKSLSRSRSRDPNAEKEEKEGSRGFMGNVRRISLARRHKRTKSGASMTSVGEALRQHSPTKSPSESVPEGRSIDVDRHTESPPSPSLLPPFELHPSSPVRPVDLSTTRSQSSKSMQAEYLSPHPALPPTLMRKVTPPSTLPLHMTKAPASPQAASLGRTASPGSVAAGVGSSSVPRRNSLGDLKIPTRISQAQVGLRRDLGLVREFAANVEQLKELQSNYHSVLMEVQAILDGYAHRHVQQVPRAVSPSFFNLPRSKSRSRSNTDPSNESPAPQVAYKQLASSFYTINSKYRIAWECAELLIELGGGSAGSGPASAPSTSVSAPIITGAPGSGNEGKKSRERAITLAGDESKPTTSTAPSTGILSNSTSGPSPPLASPPSLAWRASTGRHDLNQRQLMLLREMLTNPDSSFVGDDLIQEEASSSVLSVNRDWRWGDAMNSTITLPSEESSAAGGRNSSPTKKRRVSRLGMSGLRDMLRSLKRNVSDNPPPPIPPSTTSLSTDSSSGSHARHRYPHPEVPTQGRRRAKTSSGPESMRSTRDRPNSPYNPSSLTAKPSPRRPSLASIFRIGHKTKTTPPDFQSSMNSIGDPSGMWSRTSGQESSSTGEDEDWDHLESAADLDAAARVLGIGRDGSATIRGRSPYMQDTHPPPPLPKSGRPITPKRSASGSQTSLWADSSPVVSTTRATRLSNVEEHGDDDAAQAEAARTGHVRIGVSPSRHSRTARGGKTGSVRSMPPQPVGLLPNAKLAMTPENIKPLLENAKEVHARLTECIGEIRSLLADQS